MKIKTTCIDSGGNATASVLAFCKPRLSRRILAIKGMSGAKPIWPLRATKTRDNNKVFMIAVDTSKDVLYSRLKITDGPGQIHFQGGLCDSEFFNQLTSEVPSRRWKDGKPFRIWVPKTGVRNEVWDCMNYALAARMSLPFKDGMLQPPRTVYVDEKGEPIVRGKKPVEPSSEFDIDKVESPFPTPVKKRDVKAIARKLAGANMGSSQGNYIGYGR
jgi:phage terminase large subunit GpA-like protein